MRPGAGLVPHPPGASSATSLGDRRMGKKSFMHRRRQLNTLVADIDELPSGVEPGDDGISAQMEELNHSELALARGLSLELRRKHDELHSRRLSLQIEVGDMKSQLAELELMGPEADTGRAANSTEARLRRLEQDIKIAEDATAEKIGVSLMYGHMEQRLQKQLVECERTGTKLASELRKATRSCDDAYEGVKRVKQQQLDLSHLLRKVTTQLEEGRSRRALKNREMDRALEDSSVFFKKYNMEVDADERGAKDQAQASQLNPVYRKKGAAGKKGDDVDHMDSLAEAFSKIRAATGLSDVNAIVHKFLNREETYMSLQKASDSATQKIDSLKKEQVELKEELSSLQNTGLTAVGNRELYKEVDKYDQRLKVALKKSEDSRSKYVGLKLLLEESRVGIAKFLTLLEGQNASNRFPTAASMMPAIPDIPDALTMVESKVAGILDAVRMVVHNKGDAPRNGAGKPGEAAGNAIIRPSDEAGAGSEDAADDSARGLGEDGLGVQGDGRQASRGLAADDADDIIFQSMMTLQPDVSEKNVRVPCVGEDQYAFALREESHMSASQGSDSDENEQFSTERSTIKKLSGMFVSKTKKTRSKRQHKAPKQEKP